MLVRLCHPAGACRLRPGAVRVSAVCVCGDQLHPQLGLRLLCCVGSWVGAYVSMTVLPRPDSHAGGLDHGEPKAIGLAGCWKSGVRVSSRGLMGEEAV